VLTSARAVVKRRCTKGSKRRWLELIARVKEGVKELGREGMRCGEGRGSHRPFIGARGAPERGGRGSNGGVNGFNAIEDGGEVKSRIKGGMMAGRVTARVASKGGARRRGVAGGGEEKRQQSAGMGKEMELTGGPHMAVT
jgi:hypothetical protein